MTYDSKVKPFFTRVVFDTFDELMLHHDVCSLSFSEINTWIKKSVKTTWKAWRTKEVDWGPSPSIHTFPTGPPRHFWPKEIKRSNPTRFGKAGFGLQESPDLQRLSRLHPDSVLGV